MYKTELSLNSIFICLYMFNHVVTGYPTQKKEKKKKK